MKKTTIAGVAAACVIASLTLSRALAWPPAPLPLPPPFGIAMLAGAPGLPPTPPPPGEPFWRYPFGAPPPAEMSPDLFDITPDLMEEPFLLPLGVGVLAGIPGLPPMPPPPGEPFWDYPFGALPPAGMFPDLWDLSTDLMIDFGLTDDQLGKMLLIYVDYNDRTRQARTALAGLEDERKAMMLGGKIDQSKLAKLDQETIKLASEVMSERLRMQREQLSKLMPEQMERFAHFLSELRTPCGRKVMPR